MKNSVGEWSGSVDLPVVAESSEIPYHLSELDAASRSDSTNRCIPNFLPCDQFVLDIGCGIGQTLIASSNVNGRVLVGIDIDHEALIYGKRKFKHIFFLKSKAESLPLASGSFDCVISRVTLPYTNIPASLAEAERVLKDGGRVWFTFHSFGKTLRHLFASIAKLEYKDVIYRSFVIFNGCIFHFGGRLLPFPVNDRYESFQTKSGILRAMKIAGFIDIEVNNGRSFLCTARKRPSQ